MHDLSCIHTIDGMTNLNPWNLHHIKTSIQHHLGYVYLHHNMVVSFVIFANQIDCTEILLIATTPKYQKYHFANQLLNAVVSYNALARIDKILLDVRQSNTIAQKFYQKNGFTLLNTRKDYYRNPIEHALILEKNVKP